MGLGFIRCPESEEDWGFKLTRWWGCGTYVDILTGRKVDIQIWAIGQKVVVWLVGKLTCTHSSQSVYSTHSYKIFRELERDGVRVNLVRED